MPLTYEDLKAKIITKLNEGHEGAGELWKRARQADMITISTPQGEPIVSWRVGEAYPGAEGSTVVMINILPDEGSVPGDVRIYVLPSGAEETSAFLCYTFNRQNLAQVRETMGLEVFLEEISDEIFALPGMPEPDDEEEEEEDGPACADEDCEEEPVYYCRCDVCKQVPDEAKFYACEGHRAHVDPVHLQEKGRPAVWQKFGTVTAIQ